MDTYKIDLYNKTTVQFLNTCVVLGISCLIGLYCYRLGARDTMDEMKKILKNRKIG